MTRQEEWTIQRRLELIQLLHKEGFSDFPIFICHTDESGEIRLDAKQLLNSEDLKRLIKFCDEHKLAFQICTKKLEQDIPENQMRIHIFPKS